MFGLADFRHGILISDMGFCCVILVFGLADFKGCDSNV